MQERIFEAAGQPYGRNPIGYGMCGPTVEVHGSDEEKKRYLRPLFTGERCGASSSPSPARGLTWSVASGERDGDEWIVNGQKVWTTLAHFVRCGLLSSAPIPTSRSTVASRRASSTWRRRASRCSRSVR